MFNQKINTIKKLGELECTIYEFSTAIFLRENTIEKEKQIEKFSKIIDDIIIKSGISKNDVLENKKNILEKYEKIVQDFLEMIESLYANILEKIQQAETNQNVVFIKKATFEHFLSLLKNAKTDEEKEKLLKTAQEVNISLNNLDNKIYSVEEKIKQYNEMITACEYEFKVCESTRRVEIDKILDNLNLERILNQNKKQGIKVFGLLNEEVELLEEKVVIINANIEKYIINFISKIDVLQNRILE
ncbi:MAG: hypothetical protein J6J60_05450 [Clostridia bacterium]|nr:hypothetical protein [Clostridia bacterium]